MTQELILASQSPQRKDLLIQAGLEFKIIPANIDESLNKKEKATAYVKRMALEKAQKVYHNLHNDTDNDDKICENTYIVSADTVIATGHGIFAKPTDREDARKMLTFLSGRSHTVRTGICVISPTGEIVNREVSSKVKFKHLNKGEIIEYLNTNQWQGKAGAYAIQSQASFFIRQIIGSYSNIVGLPLHELYNILKGLGYKGFFPPSIK